MNVSLHCARSAKSLEEGVSPREALYLLNRAAETTVDEPQSHMEPEVRWGLWTSVTTLPNENVGLGSDVLIMILLLLYFFFLSLLLSYVV